MNITKYGHACLLIEEGGKRLIIDPGNYSKDLGVPQNVVAIVITHAHGDHLNKELIPELCAANPAVVIYGPNEVARAVENVPVKVVAAGMTETMGPFRLTFYGSKHADIWNGYPGTENDGVMVNGTLYFPGDSFDTPGEPVEVLATPISGPWLKSDEIADFVLAVKPKRAFSTHDAFLSEIGKQGTESWLVKAVAPDTEYILLADGETVTV